MTFIGRTWCLGCHGGCWSLLVFFFGFCTRQWLKILTFQRNVLPPSSGWLNVVQVKLRPLHSAETQKKTMSMTYVYNFKVWTTVDYQPIFWYNNY